MDGPACASRADAGLGVLEGAVAEIPSVAKWPGHTAVGSSAPGGMRVSKPHLALQLGARDRERLYPPGCGTKSHFILHHLRFPVK